MWVARVPSLHVDPSVAEAMQADPIVVGEVNGGAYPAVLLLFRLLPKSPRGIAPLGVHVAGHRCG